MDLNGIFETAKINNISTKISVISYFYFTYFRNTKIM